jgi:predicted RNA binding protein YcfA (HicA-like mRNA interferase family)
MKLPRDLAGRALANALCKHCQVVNQEGSHIILQTEFPTHQRIPVPDHPVLRIGTLNSILRLDAAHKGVERAEILRSL